MMTHGRIFKDVDNIPIGEDFQKVIEKTLIECDTVLVIIGKTFTAQKGLDGKPRIFNDDDFINFELSTALKHNKRIVPILVDNAQIPNANELPPHLISIIKLNAYEIRHERWKEDVEKLVELLKLGKYTSRTPKKKKAKVEDTQRRDIDNLVQAEANNASGTNSSERSPKRVNYIIFFTGALFTILGVYLARSGTNPTVYRIVLSLGATLITSQLADFVSLTLPMGVKAAGGFAFGVLIYLFSPSINPDNNTSHLSKSATDGNLKQIRVALLTSGNADYINDIKDSFEKTLRDSLPKYGYTFTNSIVRVGPGPFYDSSQIRDIYIDYVHNLTTEKDVDYFVSIGTPASKAFNQYFDSLEISDKKFIFLGVTDPVAEGLCNSINRTSDLAHPNVSGVAYCGNFEDLPYKITEIYPEKKMVFMYNRKIVQDQRFAQRLSEIPLTKRGVLKIVALNRQPVPDDFKDPDAVYFSWETFEEFITRDWTNAQKIKHLISTTASHVKRERTPFAISTDDSFIGRQGAQMLIDNLIRARKLGNMKILVPPWNTFVNKKLARDLGVSNEAIEKADIPL